MLFYSQIEDFLKRLNDIEKFDSNIITISRQVIILCRNELNFLKNLVKEKGFNSLEEEIKFFKEIKQVPSSYLIYYSEIYAFECKLSKTSIKLQQKFIDKTRNRTYQFLVKHLDFVNYIDQGQTHLDVCYFTRNQSIQIMMMHTDDYFYDLDFNTSHDMLLAKVNGFQRFLNYLDNRLDSTFNKSSKSKLKWTSSKTALTELIYALYYSRSINHGDIDKKDIVIAFQKLFNFELGDFYKTLSEIKSRKKSRTRFLDELSINFINEMEKSDL